MILVCPGCLRHKEWEFNWSPPGKCRCGTFQNWRVQNKPPSKGFVRLLTDDGYIELHGPSYLEKDGTRVKIKK